MQDKVTGRIQRRDSKEARQEFVLLGMSPCFEWEANKASAYIEHNLELGSLALPLQTLMSGQEGGRNWVLRLHSASVIQPLRSRSPDHDAGETRASVALGADSACVAGVVSGAGSVQARRPSGRVWLSPRSEASV